MTAKKKAENLKCWPGYHRVPGTRPGAKGSCAKDKSTRGRKKSTHARSGRSKKAA